MAYNLRWDDGVRVTTKPTVDFSADKLLGAPPLDVQFQDLTTPLARAWSWTFGDGTTSASKSPVHVYTEPGWYGVSLVATVGAGNYTRQKPAYIHVILDQDEGGAGDGMDDAWELAYFGHDLAKPGDDADGDGKSNLDEFHSGTDPVVKGSVLAVLTFQVQLEGKVKLGFQATESFSYEIQVRNTLDPTGEWIGLTSVRAACTCTLEVTVHDRYPAHGYYRVAARQGP